MILRICLLGACTSCLPTESLCKAGTRLTHSVVAMHANSAAVAVLDSSNTARLYGDPVVGGSADPSAPVVVPAVATISKASTYFALLRLDGMVVLRPSGAFEAVSTPTQVVSVHVSEHAVAFLLTNHSLHFARVAGHNFRTDPLLGVVEVVASDGGFAAIVADTSQAIVRQSGLAVGTHIANATAVWGHPEGVVVHTNVATVAFPHSCNQSTACLLASTPLGCLAEALQDCFGVRANNSGVTHLRRSGRSWAIASPGRVAVWDPITGTSTTMVSIIDLQPTTGGFVALKADGSVFVLGELTLPSAVPPVGPWGSLVAGHEMVAVVNNSQFVAWGSAVPTGRKFKLANASVVATARGLIYLDRGQHIRPAGDFYATTELHVHPGCTACSAGKFSSRHGAWKCTDCAPGEWSGVAASRCNSCTLGACEDTLLAMLLAGVTLFLVVSCCFCNCRKSRQEELLTG